MMKLSRDGQIYEIGIGSRSTNSGKKIAGAGISRWTEKQLLFAYLSLNGVKMRDHWNWNMTIPFDLYLRYCSIVNDGLSLN